MVDFQSRDTRRGIEEGEEDTDGADSEGEEEAEPEADTEPEERGEPAADEPGPETVTYAVTTVVADRSLEEDRTGDGIIEVIEESGGAVVTRELLARSYDGVQTAIAALARRGDVDVVVTAGGTGVEPGDVTVDAVEDLLDKHLPGFGELFRVLSHDHEGTGIVRTRATAGIIDDVPVFCLPGDPEAARRGVEEIVVAEAGDLAAEAETS